MSQADILLTSLYEGDSVISSNVVIIPKTNASSHKYRVDWDDDGSGLLVAGNTYIVTVDGVRYECVAYDDPETTETLLGDDTLPFLVRQRLDYVNVVESYKEYESVFTYPDGGSHIIEVTSKGTIVENPSIVNRDDEPHIVIGKDRYIVVPEELKRIGVESDHNIETYIFDCPRYWDARDLSRMRLYVNYMCANKVVGSYPVQYMWIDEVDNELMHFEWVISNNVTQAAGALSFLVCAKMADDAGYLENKWHTELNEEMYVSKGLDAEEMILELHPDILTRVLVLADAILPRAAVYVGPGNMPEGYNVQIDTSSANILRVKDANGVVINIPQIKGEKGDPFTYEDFTPEQLEALKVVGPQGNPGINGTNGITPHIGENGNWWIGDVDTGVLAFSYTYSQADIEANVTELRTGKLYFVHE